MSKKLKQDLMISLLVTVVILVMMIVVPWHQTIMGDECKKKKDQSVFNEPPLAPCLELVEDYQHHGYPLPFYTIKTTTYSMPGYDSSFKVVNFVVDLLIIYGLVFILLNVVRRGLKLIIKK